MRITIIGAGAFGTALGKILVENKQTVNFFDVKNQTLTLEVATAKAEAVVLAIPSEAVEKFMKTVPERLKKVPLILATKGLLSPALFKDFEDFAVLSGPAFASEIIAGKTATLTGTSKLVKKLFENKQIEIELTNDVLGVMLCGSLKNIYAIGAGAVSSSQNALAAYIEDAHGEMRKYLSEHGAKEETADLACGIGDLVLTATSLESRNFKFGRLLMGAGQNAELVMREGTIEGLAALKKVDRKDYPLIKQIYKEVKKYEV